MARAPDNLFDLLRARGETAGRDAQTALGISQPTLSRLVRAAGERVLQIGRARATRYALAREVRTFGSSWPVHRIDPEGRASVAGHLRAIHPDGWWFESLDPVLRRLHDGVAPTLPRFLRDLRPAGFAGEVFARRHGHMLGLGPDPREWNDESIFTVLFVHGHDLPGDVVVGDLALERLRGADIAAIPEVQRPSAYAARALAVAEDVPIQLVGGSHPKFAACVRSSDGTMRQVLVKVATSPRQADVLRCEHLAAVVLRAHHVDACETEWIEDGDRAFLEVRRFDRVGVSGRRGMISMRGLVDAEASSPDDAGTLQRLTWFGQLIGDDDMHPGRVCLMVDAAWPLRLAPIFGMSPNRFMNETWVFDPPPPTPDDLPAWRSAAVVAEDFWGYAAEDPHLSDDFRAKAARALDVVAGLRGRL
jgi:hypothetical protein